MWFSSFPWRRQTQFIILRSCSSRHLTSIMPTVIILSQHQFMLNYTSLFKRSLQGTIQEKRFLKRKRFYSAVLFYELETVWSQVFCLLSKSCAQLVWLRFLPLCVYAGSSELSKLSRSSTESVESQSFHKGYREGKGELLLVFKWKYLPLQIKKRPSICAC